MARVEYLSVAKEHESGGTYYKVYNVGFRFNGTYDLNELFDVLGNLGWEFVRETYSEILFKRQAASQPDWSDDEDEENSIDVTCPHCGAELFVVDGEDGDVIECADCGREFVIKHGMAESNEFEIDDGVLIKYIGKDGNAIIPDDVTEIGDNAFFNCRLLKSVTIPESVTKIGDLAFYNCGKLSEIVLPSSITSIGNNAFDACQGLKSVIFSVGLRSIGKSAFSSCGNLNKIIIPNTVISIGDYAFENCEALERVVLSKSITEIKSHTFSGCKSLENIVIPDGVTDIGSLAFYQCKKMIGAVIPSSVEDIEIMAFDECRKLTIYASEGSYAAEYATKEKIPLSSVEDYVETTADDESVQDDSFERDCCALLEILEKLKSNKQLDRIQAMLRPYVLTAESPAEEDEFEDIDAEEWYDDDEYDEDDEFDDIDDEYDEDDEDSVSAYSMLDDETRKRLSPVDLDD